MRALPSGLVPLIETMRGAARDNLHFGAIAVADTDGGIVVQAGDPHLMAFTRSTLKALQALPFMEADGASRLGFTRENVALLCASHSGEAMHVAQVEQILAKAGVDYKALQCGCQVPIFAQLRIGEAPPDTHWDERHHNCSGKHSGFLAYCAMHGLSLQSYLDPEHPLQQAVRRDVARAAGLAPQQMALGIDGCSAPNYALPLSALARAFARLATGGSDRELGASFAALRDAMTAHPQLVSGTGRNDNDFMRAGRGDWVSKVGADGIQVVGSASRGQALVVKIIDGNPVALHAATVAALDQLGWLDDAQREQLRPWRAGTVTNWRGIAVGERRAVFDLRSKSPAGA